MRRLVYALLLLFILPGIVLGSTYEEIKQHGSVITDQVNQVREPNLVKKYFLYKLADQRAQERVDEYLATGTPEFEHDIERAKRRLEGLGVCYNWVGEVIGRAHLRTSPPAATADDAVDLWEESPDHNAVIKASSGDWGGGGFVESHVPGYYFFAFYVVDVCGI